LIFKYTELKGKNMNIRMVKGMTVFATLLLVMVSVLETDAFARAGGGRSFGSRGSRSYSRPATPYTQPAPSQATPYNQPYQPQPAGGGFFRNMAGGIVGGMLGGMLFRGLGFGGGGFGGSGIGLFEIILIAGICYMIYRMVRRKREEPVSYQGTYDQGGYQQSYAPPPQDIPRADQPGPADLSVGLANIRQMDPYFDENRFNDNVMDIFFKVQSAWMNRDLAPVGNLLTDEMKGIFQGEIDKMLREKRVNRLENIAVRSVEPTEAWQEQGQDYIIARIYANLLDYTTDDATGAVVDGNKTDPVKFEEYWTFVRLVGNNPWRLSAITQA
jgi:predicted lipid-binding transport protein (Tim44 family)